MRPLIKVKINRINMKRGQVKSEQNVEASKKNRTILAPFEILNGNFNIFLCFRSKMTWICGEFWVCADFKSGPTVAC